MMPRCPGFGGKGPWAQQAAEWSTAVTAYPQILGTVPSQLPGGLGMRPRDCGVAWGRGSPGPDCLASTSSHSFSVLLKSRGSCDWFKAGGVC